MVFFLFTVKTCYIPMTRLVAYLRRDGLVTFERIGFLSAAVHGNDLMCPTGREGRQIDTLVRIGRVGHRTCQGIGLEEIPGRFLGLQLNTTVR